MDPSPGAFDRVIHALAARQHGVVARRQLLAEGIRAHRIDYGLRQGRLHRVYRGVYAVGPVPGRFQRPMAAVLARGDGVWVGHRTAATAWGIADGAGDGVVHLVTERDVRVGDPAIRIRRVGRIEPDEVTLLDGLPITSPARTILDLAANETRRDLEAILARAQEAGGARRQAVVRPDDLRRVMDRHPNAPGRGLLRSLLDGDAAPALTRSEAERRLLDLVRSAQLPAPRTNARVAGHEVDFLWPMARLVVEVDGRAYHAGDRAFERDRRRDARLMAAGYAVMRVTWKQIVNDRDATLARLAQALARRGG